MEEPLVPPLEELWRQLELYKHAVERVDDFTKLLPQSLSPQFALWLDCHLMQTGEAVEKLRKALKPYMAGV